MAFEHFHPGRKPPHPDETHPKLYIDPFLNFRDTRPEPATLDLDSQRIRYPMDRNDRLGICGPAGADHAQMCWNFMATGSCQSWGDQVVTQVYNRVGGYVEGDYSTDNGIVLQDMLNFWRREGVQKADGSVDKILAFGALRDWHRPARIAAMRNFGPLYKGVNLPQSALDQFPSAWTAVPGSPIAGGHCIIQVAELESTNEIRYVSWGAVVSASKMWAMSYTEEAWVIISPDWVEKNGSNPEGVNAQDMNDALAALTRTSNPLGLTFISGTGGWEGR